MRRSLLSILRDAGLAVAVAAFLAWLGLRLWPDALLVIAAMGLLVWFLAGRLERRDRERIHLAKTRALGAILTAGENVLRWIETERPAPDPARRLFSELRLADAAAQWYAAAKQGVEVAFGPGAVAQFDSRAGLVLRRPKPDLPANLADYWDSVAWRLEWINDRMNHLANE